jgi:opacity protein-like surface antigen
MEDGRRKRMKRTAIGLLTAAILLAAAPAARAQVGIYLGFQGGVSSQKVNFEGVDFDRDTTFVYGLRAGVKVLMVAAELQFLQAAHNLNTDSVLAPIKDWDARRVRWNYYGLNLRVLLPFPIVSPYLTGGYGYYGADVDAIGDDRSGGWNAGLGLEVRLGRKLALTAEGRYHRARFDIQNGDLKVGTFTLAGGMNVSF